jgi:hypothetical protein
MADLFRTLIPALSEEELRRYVENSGDYQVEAVEAAVAELGRRGHPVSGEEWSRILASLQRREADRAPGPWFNRLLGKSLEARMSRIRLITASLLATGFGAAVTVYLTARPKGGNPLGYEPEDTKKYLRDLELYGGKENVIANDFRTWFEGLWHGRSLAYTLVWLTLATALVFWFISTRVARDPEADSGDDPGAGTGS